MMLCDDPTAATLAQTAMTMSILSVGDPLGRTRHGRPAGEAADPPMLPPGRSVLDTVRASLGACVVALLAVPSGGATPAIEPARPDTALAHEMQRAILVSRDVGRVAELLRDGADPNAPIGCGTYAPLDGAVQNQNVAMLKLLLDHGAKPRGRELPAAALAASPHVGLEMVETLIGAGVDPNARDRGGNALVGAAFRSNEELVRFLVLQPGIDLDDHDETGNTALMWAAKNGASDIVSMLLRAGARADAMNARGETATSLALQTLKRQRSIVEKLRSSIAAVEGR